MVDKLRDRWERGRLGAELRREVRVSLAQGFGRLREGEVQAARLAFGRAHALSQNDPLRHAAAHLALGALSAAEGRPLATLSEGRLALMAVPASALRRAAGLLPGQDNGPGLWPTWRDRHALRAAPPHLP